MPKRSRDNKIDYENGIDNKNGTVLFPSDNKFRFYIDTIVDDAYMRGRGIS